MKYTKEDVIIWADDPRLEGAIGKECYFADSPTAALNYANAGQKESTYTLTEINISDDSTFPFVTNYQASWMCIVIIKEPKKKYIPFDLSLKEDRDALRGKWVVRNSEYLDEIVISRFTESTVDIRVAMRDNMYSAKDLLYEWTFLDGSPVGKEIEE